MRFISIHKEDRNSKADVPPSAELVAGIGRLIEEGLKTGTFLRGEGLGSSLKRKRLTSSNGKLTILNGLPAGSNELIGGVMIILVKSSDEALEWASRLASVLGDGEIEVGQVKEPWDVGMCPKPEGLATLRFLLVQKADPNSEAVPLSAETIAGLEDLKAEMVKAGVFLGAEALYPSAQGARLKYSAGKRTLVDGPFTEAKELIGGFSIIQVASKAEAIAWSRRFADVFLEANIPDDLEIDIYQLGEAADTEGRG